MLDDYGFEIYEENEFPLAYLITFRTFGTWLHGDDRSSINRSNRDVPGTVKLDPNVPLREHMLEKMAQPPVILDSVQRRAVTNAIEQLCGQRNYSLHGLNVRTNHVHAVVAAAAKPERIADAMKAFATKRLRELGLVGATERVWSRGRSRRYLWKPLHVEAAVNYVLYCQGDLPFEMDDWVR
jgi:REP element-mobilizing transposase RayT